VLVLFSAGEDADLCTELLRESLEALQDLPEATLFDETCVSPVWLEVVDRSTRFLRQVVTGCVKSKFYSLCTTAI
jgi:E3 ubiquitin-protein ligase HERC2